MIAGKKVNPCKPLASKGPSKLGPICFVDATTRTSGPQLHVQDRVLLEAVARVKEERALEAALQWSSTVCSEDGDKPWLKSWYYPTDAFIPWPQKTDLCCWWCSCPFDWSPFPLPYAYDSVSNRYKSVGMFCGPSCAKAYAMNSSHYCCMSNINYYIEHVASAFYGYKLHTKTGASKMCTIPEAPPKEILQKFCGPSGFTIEQYRAMCCCGRHLAVLAPNIITMKQVIEAQQELAKTRTVYHPENPDNLQCLSNLLTKKRIPFAGLGVKRMSDFIKTRS